MTRVYVAVTDSDIQVLSKPETSSNTHLICSATSFFSSLGVRVLLRVIMKEEKNGPV